METNFTIVLDLQNIEFLSSDWILDLTIFEKTDPEQFYDITLPGPRCNLSTTMPIVENDTAFIVQFIA